MWTLVYKEFTQLKSYLLQTLVVVTAILLILGNSNPGLAGSYLMVFTIVSAMTIPQLSFAAEERGNTFVFLRSLPIQPAAIVGAKYAASCIIILALVVLLGAVNAIVSGDNLGPTISVAFAVSSFIAALNLFLHFLLGAKRAKSTLLAGLVILSIPTVFLTRSPEILTGYAANEFITKLLHLLAEPAGFLLALFFGTGVMLLSLALAALVFARRDISMLP